LNNDQVEFENIFKKIAEIYFDDGVKFDPLSISSERIKENADYEGIRLKIDATLDQARKRLQVIIGFGDIIIPKAKKIEFPTLLEQIPPKIKVYSIESIISEKFEAMIKLAMANSRMKDFYDVYTLSINYNFNGNRLKKAIESTFKKRKTIVPISPLIFQTEFHNDKGRQRQWASFLRKSGIADTDEKFNQIMNRITEFLRPIIISIKNKTIMEKIWYSSLGHWKK